MVSQKKILNKNVENAFLINSKYGSCPAIYIESYVWTNLAQ